MKMLCTICARGGSVGVKNKNIRLLGSKPLIAHTIVQAQQSGLFEHIAVSSDADTILAVAQDYGVDLTIKRPDAMATPTAAKLPVIRHAAEQAEQHFGEKYDILVDLDATSPLRCVDDIRGAVKLLRDTGADNVITAAPARRSPYFNLVELDKNDIVKLSKPLPHGVTRRQDSPHCFDMNASIYVWQREALFASETLFTDNTRLFVMPEERSLDIDSELDFKLVSCLAAEREDLST